MELETNSVSFVKEEKLKKVEQGFSLLPDEKQNHVLGIMQALVFAGDKQGEATRLPIKNFESLGLVFTEFTLTHQGDNFQGNVQTYRALLMEAHNLGADAIINVTIDRVTTTTTVTTGGTTTAGSSIHDLFYEPITSNITTVYTWYGTALAIRYTTALTQEGLVVNDVRRIGSSN